MPVNNNSHAHHRSRMRDRYKRCGMDGLAEHEALEVYLFRCLRQVNTNGIAHALLNRFGNLSRIFSRKNRERYMQVDYVGEKTAFILENSAENMEKAILDMMHAEPEYNPGKVMVFSRFMMRRIPENHVLLLRYDAEDRFRNYTILPVPEENWSDWILQCLAVTQTGESLHIRIPENTQWQPDKCLHLGLELCKHTRKLRSIQIIKLSGETISLYE